MGHEHIHHYSHGAYLRNEIIWGWRRERASPEVSQLQTETLKATGEMPSSTYKWSSIRGLCWGHQQTIARGRESELSSCFGTNYPALLRFGKVTSVSETVLGELRHSTGEGFSMPTEILEGARQPVLSRCCSAVSRGRGFKDEHLEEMKS